MIKHKLEIAFDEEIEAQLSELKASDPKNRKDGHTRKKTVKEGIGKKLDRHRTFIRL